MGRDRDTFAEGPLPPEDDRPPRRRRRDDADGPRGKAGGGTVTLIVLLSVGGVGLLVCAGCGVIGYFAWQGDRAVAEAEADLRRRSEVLKEIGKGYSTYCHANNRRPPQKPEDLELYVKTDELALLRRGEITMVWNVLPEFQPPDRLLAYYTKPEANGGRLVLLTNRTVRPLTEAEFNNVPRAQPPKDEN